MKFVVGENGRNPEKNLPRPRFVHHEPHMERPRRELGTPAVEGERLTACATRPPQQLSGNIRKEAPDLQYFHSRLVFLVLWSDFPYRVTSFQVHVMLNLSLQYLYKHYKPSYQFIVLQYIIICTQVYFSSFRYLPMLVIQLIYFPLRFCCPSFRLGVILS